MSKLTCDVVFYKNVNYGFTNCMNVDVGEAMGEHMSKEHVEVGRLTNITIDLKDDTTLEEIEILRAEKEKINAEAHVKSTLLEERIQSLLAIEFKS